ncbi:MAG: hypothetical protein P4M09_05995 [Devosia sp.]|nr:hypothetical protein [Devosia sp.]
MATPAQMMETLAEVTRIPLATIVDHDRKLTKAGLRTKGGRGFSVAQVTSLDVARLLTSILAGSRATDAASAVERYVHAIVDRARSGEAGFAIARLDDLAKLPPRHSFVDALVAVITSAAKGSIATLVKTGAPPHIEVFALTRATRGRIRITGLPDGETVSVEYGPTGTRPTKPGGTGQSPEEDVGDFEQSRRITERTILSVAELLAKGENYA